MPVRVKLKIKSKLSNTEVETSALVNSGFTTDRPQLIVPRRLAIQLGLWPPPPESFMVELGTAGGPVRNYLVPNSIEVCIVEPDRSSSTITCDAIISHIEEEVLINDMLGEQLGIVLLGLASGKWRFIDDPPGKVRESYPQQLWT